ncbi:30S ribosomal protein S2 [Salisaeta longa]|uniref:30S ribosomal protein S2 n=1 Tax=Salisaeta longa TaxID=503170 RepID=UPI0003B776DC|nr:30S ribosomal protein S2 [Salisaeta longa]
MADEQTPKEAAAAAETDDTTDTDDAASAADTDAAAEDAATDASAADDAPATDDTDADDADDEEADVSDEAGDTDDVDEDDVDEDDAADDDDADDADADPLVSIEELLKAGAHFGHLTSRWNPRMEPYIFMKRNNIHIIDLMQTQGMLAEAAKAARRFARRGKSILFAGTKKQASDIVRRHAEACNMPFMVDRWLGGTMTNFQTIRRSIRRMEEIEKMEKDGTLDKLKKKEKLMRLREHEKLENTLGGIRNMPRVPGAIFIVDVRREDIAVSESLKLGIPIIAMVDTNGDPRDIDYPIPANDDALSSIELVTSTIAAAIQEGQKERQAKKQS